MNEPLNLKHLVSSRGLCKSLKSGVYAALSAGNSGLSRVVKERNAEVSSRGRTSLCLSEHLVSVPPIPEFGTADFHGVHFPAIPTPF